MPLLFSNKTVQLENTRLKPVSNDHAEALGKALSVLSPWSTLSISALDLTSYLSRADPALHRYSILIEGKLAGVVAIRSPWLRGPYLELLAVLPGFQRRGIGRHVLEWMEREVRGKRDNLWVVTSDFNAPALKFYAAHGFEITGTLQGLVRENLDEILLRKQL